MKTLVLKPNEETYLTTQLIYDRLAINEHVDYEFEIVEIKEGDFHISFNASPNGTCTFKEVKSPCSFKIQGKSQYKTKFLTRTGCKVAYNVIQ